MGSMSQVSVEKSDVRKDPLMRIDGISAVFERTDTLGVKKTKVRAVDGVSFDLYEGEFLSIVGETGSGKTTVARCLLGLTSPSSGAIRFGGQDISKLKGKNLRAYRKSVQIIYQDPFSSLVDRQTVLENIATPIKYLLGEKDPNKIKEIVSNLLQEVGLKPEMINRHPYQLSGGERQRINIARALASNPRVLIADEPITMLDAAQRLNILSLLNGLKEKRKLTLMMITHDLASAVIVSERILVMYAGRIVESGPAKIVTSKPYHPYVELILESSPNLAHKISASDNVNNALVADPSMKHSGCSFEPRCKYATSVCRERQPALEAKSTDRLAACYNPLTQV